MALEFRNGRLEVEGWGLGAALTICGVKNQQIQMELKLQQWSLGIESEHRRRNRQRLEVNAPIH